MQLCQIALSTTHLARTARWYERTFNWRPSAQKREHEGDIWARVPDLPEAKFAVSWLVEQRAFFQFELFEFEKPRMRLQVDPRPSDIGYSSIGVHVSDMDAVVDRITCTGGRLLSDPVGARGERRVCLRDPEGVLLELMEDCGPNQAMTSGVKCDVLATTRSISLSVPNLERAQRFWIHGLGLSEAPEVNLHTPKHDCHLGLENSDRRSVVLTSKDILVELTEHTRPRGRQRPAGYLLSDQGILNVALGCTDKNVFDAAFERVRQAGYRACFSPWTVPDLATVVYIQDDQGFTVELLHVIPSALTRMGFPSSATR